MNAAVTMQLPQMFTPRGWHARAQAAVTAWGMRSQLMHVPGEELTRLMRAGDAPEDAVLRLEAAND